MGQLRPTFSGYQYIIFKEPLSDQVDTRLSRLGTQEIKALEEHQQILRDQVMFRSMQGPQGFRPKNQRGKQFNKKGNQGRGYQANSFNQGNSYQNSGRGRGRGNDRANYRPRARQNNQQPSPEAPSLKKFD